MSIIQKLSAPHLVHLLQQLLKNGVVAAEAIDLDGDTPSMRPVIRLYLTNHVLWLITEYHPESGRFFGLCDLGHGFPELGYVSVEELDWLPLPLQFDESFKAAASLQRYTDAACAKGAITLSKT